MKLNGRVINKPNIVTIVIPRQNDDDLIFRAQPVLDFTEFEAVCPKPEPTVRIMPGGKRQLDTNNVDYQKLVEQWAERKYSWMILKSLQATEGLEWDTVDMADPETWSNYIKEMYDSFMTDKEITDVCRAAIAANGLDQEKIDSATESFLAGREQV
jgi:hypothetical protein